MSALRREYDPAASAGLDQAAVEKKVGADAKAEGEKAEPIKSEIDKSEIDKSEIDKSEIDKAAVRKPDKPASLQQRIKRTEERISDRRAALALRTADVNAKVRKSLSSPLLIIAAAGAGFVFAQFRKKRRPEKEDRREPVVVKPSIFASITEALTLATTLLAMMPLIRSKAKEGVQEATGEVPES